jgi:hypothetical protein
VLVTVGFCPGTRENFFVAVPVDYRAVVLARPLATGLSVFRVGPADRDSVSPSPGGCGTAAASVPLAPLARLARQGVTVSSVFGQVTRILKAPCRREWACQPR